MPLASQTIDVKQFIDDRRFSLYQWLVIALCFLILTVDAYDIVAIGYAAPSLVGEWRAGNDGRRAARRRAFRLEQP
jgi:AAHS family 4-hydroxybenzoate transporter-like MFS transporter